jgi:hypothetical protein
MNSRLKVAWFYLRGSVRQYPWVLRMWSDVRTEDSLDCQDCHRMIVIVERMVVIVIVECWMWQIIMRQPVLHVPWLLAHLLFLDRTIRTDKRNSADFICIKIEKIKILFSLNFDARDGKGQFTLWWAVSQRRLIHYKKSRWRKMLPYTRKCYNEDCPYCGSESTT